MQGAARGVGAALSGRWWWGPLPGLFLVHSHYSPSVVFFPPLLRGLFLFGRPGSGLFGLFRWVGLGFWPRRCGVLAPEWDVAMLVVWLGRENHVGSA